MIQMIHHTIIYLQECDLRKLIKLNINYFKRCALNFKIQKLNVTNNL